MSRREAIAAERCRCGVVSRGLVDGVCADCRDRAKPDESVVPVGDPMVMWDARWTPEQQDEAVALADEGVQEARVHMDKAQSHLFNALSLYERRMSAALHTRELRHRAAVRRAAEKEGSP